MKKMGFEQKEGEELVTFLEKMDEVEVEAYFYTQRLALERVFEVIMGRGSAKKRRGSPNEQAVDQVADQFTDVQQFQDPNIMSIARNSGGFGEQGSAGVRSLELPQE